MRLYLIPSPIGNLGDMTYRAVETLRSADVLLCEDTRTTGVLLRHYSIQKPLTPYHPDPLRRRGLAHWGR